jgi:hypothetical protein
MLTSGYQQHQTTPNAVVSAITAAEGEGMQYIRAALMNFLEELLTA